MEQNLILTKEKLVERRVARNEGIRSGLYYGMANDLDVFSSDGAQAIRNANGTFESIVVPAGTRWENSEGYAKLWGKIEETLNRLKKKFPRNASPQNINQFPDDYYTLVDMIRIDLTRRRIENMDFTSEIANEITNPAFSRTIRIDEFLPFAGAFAEIHGTGDNVPMIQQKTGETGTVGMHIFGLGHERSLEDELYNVSIFSLQKVNDAVARAYTNLRNTRNGIGQMVAYSLAGAWTLDQRVAASQILDANGNVMYDVSLYWTLRNALRKLMALNDPQTLQEISAQRVVLLCRENVTLWDIGRIMRGQLGGGETNGTIRQLEALPIDEIWQYKGDDIYLGAEHIQYPGVPAGHAYLFVPGPAGSPNYVLNKRGLTQEVGRGDVLTLSREKRAFYCVQGEYQDEFFGHTGGGVANTGYIVEITLPVFDEET
jgi:hypothetical protein